MSATPQSFELTTFRETRFQSTPFTPDYSRVGPEIHGNVLTNNTTNGLFVNVPQASSASPRTILSPIRWDDADVTHVLADQLLIGGQAGGPERDVVSLIDTARLDGSLIIDPGVVTKLDGGRIEVGIGGSILAEGTSQRPIILTSLLDDRFGAGGTFDSNGDATTLDIAPRTGDWGGVFLSATSEGSFDHVHFAYGGGAQPIEGEFVGFNVLEIHQARARVTNSIFEANANGVSTAIVQDRSGRGYNEPATIFVRGAQPIIVGNRFVDNEAAVININVNALNHLGVTDWGRSTDTVQRIAGFSDNQGPLIRSNVIDSNDINGMIVRGGTITTESTWDDTEIVHVVRDGIFVPNHHSFGGLRLESTATQSLVVKFLGETAGITTTGSAVGVVDHIGGAVQLVGQPGNPVVLTSFYDDTVGSGFDDAGRTQSDTDGGGRPTRTSNDFNIDLNFGPNILAFPEIVDAARQAADIWESHLQDPTTIVIDIDLTTIADSELLADNTSLNRNVQLFNTAPVFTEQAYEAVRDAFVTDAGAHESILTTLPAFNNLDVQFPLNVAVPFETSPNMTLTRANAKALGFGDGGAGVVVPSQFDNNDASIDGTILINDNQDLWDFDLTNGLKSYREDFQTHFQRELGEILGFTSSVDQVDFLLDNPDTTMTSMPINLQPLDLFRFRPGDGAANFAGSTRLMDPTELDHVFYAGGDVDFRQWGFDGITIGDIPLSRGRNLGDSNDFFPANHWRDDVFVRNGQRFEFDTIGVMDPASYLRDGVIQVNDPIANTQGLITKISEADLMAFDSIGYDVVGSAPGDWRGVEIQRLSHDGNIAFGSEVEAADGDVGSDNSLPSTAEFIGTIAPNRFSGDNTIRLGFEQHGVISQPTDVDVYSFRGIAGTDVWIDIDGTSSGLDTVVELISATGTTLARSDDSIREEADPSLLQGTIGANPLGATDVYSTSIHDAGMQVNLPGATGSTDTYYVRVSSNSGQGRYELQVRLQARDEVPGVSINHADIRYANVGLKIVGPPTQSPLLGDQAEDERINDYFREGYVFSRNMENFVDVGSSISQTEAPYSIQAQSVGDLLSSRKGAISIFGTLENVGTGGDVDFYEFTVAGDAIARAIDDGEFDITDFLNIGTSDVVIDIDYALPDTTLALFNNNGELLFYSDDSNIPGDQVIPGSGVTTLQGGSFSTEDAFIGPVTLSPFDTYYLAVSASDMIPEVLLDASTTVADIAANPGRGQQVTGTNFFEIGKFADNPNASIFGSYEGPYQLEIRILTDPNDVTSGDVNRDRPQGQIVVSNSSIANSRTWGIVMEDAFRDLPDYSDVIRQSELAVFKDYTQGVRQDHGQFNFGDFVPHSGVPMALPGFNEERIIPGITIENNVISGGLDGGLQLGGDPNGFILSVSNIHDLVDVTSGDEGREIVLEQLNNAQFTIWDHHRNSQTFQFTTDGAADADFIPVRIDGDATDTQRTDDDIFTRTIPNPTWADTIMDEIEHAIRLSDLDLKVFRTRGNDGGGSNLTSIAVPTGEGQVEEFIYRNNRDDNRYLSESEWLFVEGAIEIGFEDVIRGDNNNAWFPNGSNNLAFMTSYSAQQGAVPHPRVINNTLVGRGGDLFDGNGVGDVGISLEDNISPTLLNNVISNFEVGIQADLSANDNPNDRYTFIGGQSSLNQAFISQNTWFGAVDSGGVTVGPPGFSGGVSMMAINDTSKQIQGGGAFNWVGRDHLPQDLDQPFFAFEAGDETPFAGGRPTIVGANVYQGNLDNNVNIGVGDFPIILGNNDPLFVDAANGSFFLEAGSQAIDSSLDFLDERSYLLELMNAVGLDSDGIQSPGFDSLGIQRIDDPSVEPPFGIGSNVFKDRGALERADFVGPSARLIAPLDNDASGVDQDPNVNAVALFNTSVPFFELLLTDGSSIANTEFGSGINDLSVDVTAAAGLVTITRDGVTLVQDTDYFVTYNSTNDSLLVTPAAGLWPAGSQYVLSLDNTQIMDNANNPLQVNQGDGSTRFLISTSGGFDFGDAPSPYPTLDGEDGARHAVDNTTFLGLSVAVEVDGKPSSGATADTFDDGINIGPLFANSVINVTANASRDGFLNAWLDMNGNDSWDDAGEQIFVNRRLASGDNALTFFLPANVTTDLTYARFRFSTAAGLGPTGLAPDGEVEDYAVQVTNNPWQNPGDPLDVNGDGSVVAQDALFIINELDLRENSDALTGELMIPATNVPFFYDVNGDGFVSPIDALNVINALPSNIGAMQAPLSSGTTNRFDEQDDTNSNALADNWDLEDVLSDVAADVATRWYTQG